MAHVAGRQDKSIFITALASTFINCHLLTDVLCDIVVHTMVSVLASCKFLTLIYPSSIERFHMGLVFQNNETAAILVFRNNLDNLVRVEISSYETLSFVPIKLHICCGRE